MLCPRCGKRALKDVDQWYCLVHGTFNEPKRPWDVPSGTRGDVVPSPRWTLEEMALWGRWRPGEPLPEEYRHYQCEICGVRYAERTSVTRHKREKHAGAEQLSLVVG